MEFGSFHQVLLDLPERSEVTLYTGMTSLQKKLYKSILMRDTSELSPSNQSQFIVIKASKSCVQELVNCKQLQLKF